MPTTHYDGVPEWLKGLFATQVGLSLAGSNPVAVVARSLLGVERVSCFYRRCGGIGLRAGFEHQYPLDAHVRIVHSPKPDFLASMV